MNYNVMTNGKVTFSPPCRTTFSLAISLPLALFLVVMWPIGPSAGPPIRSNKREVVLSSTLDFLFVFSLDGFPELGSSFIEIFLVAPFEIIFHHILHSDTIRSNNRQVVFSITLDFLLVYTQYGPPEQESSFKEIFLVALFEKNPKLIVFSIILMSEFLGLIENLFR